MFRPCAWPEEKVSLVWELAPRQNRKLFQCYHRHSRLFCASLRYDSVYRAGRRLVTTSEEALEPLAAISSLAAQERPFHQTAHLRSI
eukprot:9019117-Pyramimonas_sp.AAC.1